MKLCIYARWNVIKYRNSHFINQTHLTYLDYLRINNEVTVLTSITDYPALPSGYVEVSEQINFAKLPADNTYFGAYSSFYKHLLFLKSFFKNNKFDLLYIRCPDPLNWLAAIIASRKCRVTAHFVGDSVDATWRSNSNLFTKLAKILLFLPEYVLLLIVCKFIALDVFTNGKHIAKKLKKYRISAKPVVSSTLLSSEGVSFQFIKNKDKTITKLLYVGYLRPSKGLFELVEAFYSLSEKYESLTLTIVGKGESESALKDLVYKKGLHDKISFLGHIDSKVKLNEIYKSHDVFCFPSHSEGSPRVVIEAMFFGLLVVSTPVGSLPYSFNKDELLFTEDFKCSALEKALIKALELNASERVNIKKKALGVVKANYSLDKFLDKVFG